MDMINIGKGGSDGEYAKMRHAVRKWVHDQTWRAMIKYTQRSRANTQWGKGSCRPHKSCKL